MKNKSEEISGIDWKRELDSREKEYKELNKQLRDIKRNMKSLGAVTGIEIIAELISKEYGVKCKVINLGKSNVKELAIYPSSATPKQVRYNRSEVQIGCLLIYERDGMVYDASDDYVVAPLNFGLDEIYNMAINKKKK